MLKRIFRWLMGIFGFILFESSILIYSQDYQLGFLLGFSGALLLLLSLGTFGE
jgi:hypothetical protein